MIRLMLLPALLVVSALAGCGPAVALTPPPLSNPPAGTAVPMLPTEATSTPTSVPFIPTVLRLTEPGCCVQPFWSTDSRTVEFIDKPESTEKSGVYGVSIDGGTMQLINEQVGLPSPDGKYLAFLNGQGKTVIRELASQQDTIIDNDGQRPFFSPKSKRLAWAIVTPVNVDVGSRVEIHVADIDGKNDRSLITVYNGGVAGWLDDDRILIAGRKQANTLQISLFSIDLNTNNQFDVATEQRMRNVSVAPEGKWILYTVTLDPNDAANDGLWVISADAQKRYKLAVVGNGWWRDGSHLLVIPLEPGAPSHRVWQFDAETGQAGSITDPAITSFRVAQGDWSVSPDGKYLVFLNEVDHALWLMTLPPINGQ